jgi:hypothetical protein
LAKSYKGEVMSTEPEFAALLKKEYYKKAAIVVVIIWAALAVLGGFFVPYLILQVVLAAIFGFIALYLYAISVRYGPMVVYEYGIEHSMGMSRKFDPWGRLMWGWEDGEGLHLRRVHGIEAAMRVLDERPEVVKVLVVPLDIPDYRWVTDYILKVLPEAHWNQGTKWRWDVPAGFSR